MGEREKERRKKEAQAVALHLGANGVFREWTTFQKFVAVRHCQAGRRRYPRDDENKKETEGMQKRGQWRNQSAKALIS
jgi:hypothetical protein